MRYSSAMSTDHTILKVFGSRLAGAVLLVLLVGIVAPLGSGSTAFAQSAPAPVQSPVTESVKHHSSSEHKIDARAHRVAKAIASDIERVEPYLERYGYWAVFAAVGVEGIGIPAPGQTLLEAGALVAAIPDSKLNIFVLLLVTILATALGQTIGYLIGRSGGRAVLNRLPIPARSLENIERGFNRYGGWLVFFGRFVDGPRQFIGLFSGVLAMHWGRFMLLNIGGAIVWASFWALGIYYLDLHFDALVTALRHVNPWVAGLTVIGIVGLLIFVLITIIRRRSQISS
ncbi:putative membrane-associated protein [Thiorhodovibrio frisius]|uniref:Putative membrane-associated protein n=2 Tax=Thiorhodovibrio frisius TaxID=631362 RepID=H8Z3A1_9GAMM|nr:putative membrane-associated protein [Thiorhodovibrio frisius]WPL21779.1 SNARE associated Golgi protein [Thiorhodovibrio frisius]